MKICFLSGTAAWGGAEVHTVGLASALAERGHDVSIIALGHDVFRKAVGGRDVPFQVRSLPLPRSVEKMSFGECASLLAGETGDVCVLARWGMDVGSLRLDLAARRRFRRYIAIEHSSAEMPPRVSRRYCRGLIPGVGLWWYRRLLLWHLRSIASNLVVCVSDAARKRLVHNYRVPRRKVITVHNGIDTQRFQPDAAHRAARRLAWGVPDDAVVFGAVGRLSHEKGFDVAITLFARLTASHPDRPLRLVLVGDGPARLPLEQAARAAGLGDQVVFAGFTDRPWEAYCGLDVFLLPSREEALPLALLEAMACGCCSIAMSVGGVGEVLGKSHLGWLVPPGAEQGFLEAMGAALEIDAQGRAALGQAAREHVAAHFNAQRQYTTLAEAIEGC